MNGRLDRSERNAELLGDIGVGEVGEVAEKQNLSTRLVEIVESPPHDLSDFYSPCQVVGAHIFVCARTLQG